MSTFSTSFIFVGLIAGSLCWGQEPGFTPLFDGKSLQGWEGNEKVFRVAEGAIVAGSQSEKVAHNEFLASKDEFGDFELRLKARLIGKGQNAGVQFRSQRLAKVFPRAHVGNWLYGVANTTALRARSAAARRRARERQVIDMPEPISQGSADWNDLIIRCEGPRVQIWVNGFQTADYTESDADVPRRGRLGLQIHGGEPAEAAYKDIQIKTLENP